ncbi:MAG: DegT/DnrJ/EryC1/StrS family aminotransferase [Fidelibacterota bacterium]
MSSKSKLAIHGGNPVRTDPFPLWPRPTQAMKDSLIHTLENERWGIGSAVVEQFEKNFAKFHDSRYALAISTGTAALWVSLKAAGVKAGDEVIIPAYTFIGTATAVLMANAVPVFADIDEETLNMDPEGLEDLVTEKTKVVLPVHIAGNPAHITKIKEICDRYSIPMLEDAAQAHGAEWKGRKVGAFGLGGIFSFQSSKNMTAGEGGAIISDDKEFIDTCYSYQNAGRVRDGEWYEHDHLGGNFRLSAFPAALLTAQIESLGKDMTVRDTNAVILDRALEKIEGLSILRKYPSTTRVSHHLYIFRYLKEFFGNKSREQFIEALNAEGIPAYSGYVPLYRERLFIVNRAEYPWLEGIDFENISLPVTERIADEQSVWLRQNCLLGSEEDTMDIVRAVEKVEKYFRR